MKKFLYSLVALALATFTLSSCEDVPMPYEYPLTPDQTSQTVEPAGSGTKADPYNVAGVLKAVSTLASGETYANKVYMKGVVTSVKECSASYGNATFYIGDEATSTKTFYVYRSAGLNGEKIASDTEIQVGDTVVVYGSITNYNGTIETVQKEAYYTYLSRPGGSTVNPGGDTPVTPDTPAGAKGTGTAADPYNVPGIIAFTQSLAADVNSAEVYFEGIVSRTKDISATYGNATFYISEDGTQNNEFYVFRCLGLNGAKIASENDVQVGQKVRIYGSVVNYKGNTPETVQNKSYLVSVGGGDTPSTGDAGKTAENPMTVAQAIAYTSSLAADTNSDNIYIKGKVSSTKDISATYGNATFYISDDGSTNNQFYVFRCLGLGNEKITSADDVKVGDEVIIYGAVVNYKGNTPETVQNKAYIYSINGKTSGGSTGGDTPSTDVPTGTSDGIAISGKNLTLTNSAATAGSETISIDLSTLGLANAAEMGTVTLSDGTTIEFAKGTNANAPKYYTATNGARVYANNTITFKGKAAIAKIEMTCDSYNGTDYVGNKTATISVSGNTLVYTNASSDAGTQLRVKTITITYAK